MEVKEGAENWEFEERAREETSGRGGGGEEVERQ